MNDIELVIKIPEKTYEQLKFLNEQGFGTVIDELVTNGTPLPKGHGDLIDSNVLCEQYNKTYGDLCQALDLTPTIIEADKEDKE